MQNVGLLAISSQLGRKVFFFPLHSFVIWPGNIFLALLTRIATRESGRMASLLMGRDAKEKMCEKERERERESMCVFV
jgi:hypothetical protein